jgi:hypothetical protein
LVEQVAAGTQFLVVVLVDPEPVFRLPDMLLYYRNLMAMA